MKVSVKKVDSLRRELKFEIPRDRVSKKLEEIYAELGKVAKIRGFRPGKAPRHLLEQHHGPLAREEMLKKLIPEV
ncbi:MAG: trigger factor family protein, partial [Candidatus Omnitrophota bacterium]|nr:trigger factor family protein [Candidatus Omnitrophota bacterium]